MPTYVTLFEHTQDGKENIETLPELFEQAAQMVDSFGGEFQGVYYGSIGEYDGLSIAQAPDGEAVEKVRLALESGGTHNFETYEVFEAEQYFGMIEEGLS